MEIFIKMKKEKVKKPLKTDEKIVLEDSLKSDYDLDQEEDE